MTIDKAIDQLDWYFQADDGCAAEPVTKEAYEILKRTAKSKSCLYDEKRYDNMPERIQETYRVLVGVCNSLNAQFGLRRRRYYISKNEEELRTSFLLERAQTTIMRLLEETGRLDEYDKWIKEQKGE